MARETGTNRKNRVGKRGPRRADQQNRAAANPIGKPAPRRSKNKLHRGKGGHDRADHEAARPEFLAIDRQQREHQPKADQINKNGQKNDQDGRLSHHSRPERLDFCAEPGKVRKKSTTINIHLS